MVAARFFVPASFFALAAGACVPTAARKNARLTEGFGADLTGGVQIVEPGEDSSGNETAGTGIPHAELDLEYVHKLDDGSGLAVQGKFPVTVVFTTIDVFYELPENNSRWFFGFGAEVGALPGTYAVATHYLDDSFYVSLTPRVLYAKSRGEKAVLLNPQLALGFEGTLDLAAFASFAHHTGRGFDFDIDLFGPNDREDYRKNYWLAGISAHF